MGIPLPALTVQPPQIGDPLKEYAKAVSLRALQQQTAQQAQMGPLEVQSAQLQVQQQQQDAADQQAATKAMQEWDGKRLEDMPVLMQKHGASAKAVFGMKATVDKRNQELESWDATRLANEAKRNDMLLGRLSSLSEVPDEQLSGEVLKQANSALRDRLLDPDSYNQVQAMASQSPQAIRSALSMFEKTLKGAKQQFQERQDAEKQRMDALSKTQVLQGPEGEAHRYSLNPETGKFDIDQGLAASAESGKTTDVNQYIDNYFKMKGWNADEKAPDYPQHWAEAHKAFTTETKTEPGAVRAQIYVGGRLKDVFDKNLGQTVPMSVEEIRDISSREPDRLTSPGYDPDVQGAIAAGRSLAPKNLGLQIQSYGTFIRHTGDAYDAVRQLQNTNFPLINRPINWLRTNSGDPRVKSFLAKLAPVQKEYESLLLYNRALYEDDRREMQNIIDENTSPAAMLAVLPSFIKTGTERIEETNAAYRRVSRGKDIPDLLTPEAKAVIRKMGVQVPKSAGNVPGNAGGNVSVTAPDGSVHVFPNQESADKFKKLANIP